MTTPPLLDARQSEPVQLPTDRECPFNPPNDLSRLRESQPLSRLRFSDGQIGWLVTSHELARAVLGDPRFSIHPGGFPSMHPDRHAAVLLDAIQHDSAFPDATRTLIERYQRAGQLPNAFRDPEVVRALHEHPLSTLPFFNMDPPEHSRLRRALAGHFTVRRISEYRAQVEQIVADRLDVMEQLGPPVDLVEAFALAIPSLLTCALFGVPESERDRFERHTTVRQDPSAAIEDVVKSTAEFREFAHELIARKRAQPADDLLSALVRDGKMTDDELASTAVILVRGAHATTATTLAFGILALLADRNRWNVLRTESGSIDQIIEELLRYTAVSQSIDVRTALEDVELGGTVIKAFENVAVSLAAANRDPQVFPAPDQVDLTRREAAKHLTFGYGIHQCIGQHLARLEMRVALTGLARRFPALDLAVPVADIPWHSGERNIYGPQRVPVIW